MTLAIQTRALHKSFGATTAVRSLSLEVERGEVFGFLGPNGAGKTTSVKLLLGLVRATGGQGQLLGKRLGDVATRARVGYLPEHFRFHEWLTGRQLLGYHGRLCGLPRQLRRERLGSLLERLELAGAADRRIRNYSKGMRQRLGLAQALIGEPEVVFLDEPTSGLDPLGRRLVREVIREQRERGTTVFLNSHLLSEVEITCDRVAFIREGCVVRELDLRDQATAGSIGLDVILRVDCAPEPLLEGLRRFGETVSSEGQQLSLRVTSEAALPELTRWLASEGVGLYELRPSARSLEEVFLEVVGDGGEGS